MKVILEEAEIQAAVKAYMGTDYAVKDIKVVVGRARSATRIEVEVEKTTQITTTATVTPSVTEPIEEVPAEAKQHSGPIFSKIEEE